MKRGVVLISGGLRSSIAAKRLHLQMQLIGVHFGPEPEHLRELARKIGVRKLILIDKLPASHDIKDVFMLKVAQQVARANDADILITGRSMPHIGSDMIKKIAFINKQIKMPIHRPVLHESKQVLVEEAKHDDLLFLVDEPTSLKEEPFNQREVERSLAKINVEQTIPGLLKKHIEVIV